MNDIIEYHTYNRVDFSLKQLYYHVSIVLYIFFVFFLSHPLQKYFPYGGNPIIFSPYN